MRWGSKGRSRYGRGGVKLGPAARAHLAGGPVDPREPRFERADASFEREPKGALLARPQNGVLGPNPLVPLQPVLNVGALALYQSCGFELLPSRLTVLERSW